jgi:NADPH-dependent 2,4-dienoyl-CoA reductase/sulfur reductase-like enzyme
MRRTAVVVGSSVAGVRTVRALRSEGFDGEIVLVGAESELPYDKPPLSKQFLSGERDASRISLLTEADAAALDVQLRLGARAVHLDVAARRVVLADGSWVPYDACVVATGAAARPSPWGARSGVHVVRSLGDSTNLREDLLLGGAIVVVGGGFIGAEVAATAHRLGGAVTIVDPLPAPLARVLGPEVGGLFAGLHERHGVATRFGTGVTSIEGESGDLEVRLTDGTVLRAATVVVGIGAVPNDRWLASSGLLVDDGVVCDEFCRAVDATDVYAVGDVARWWHPGHGEHVRVEHWTNAVDQAVCVAHNIAHPDDPREYRPVEYVWSDQYDWKIQIVGRPATATGYQVIGDFGADRPRAAAVYTDSTGRLTAAVTVNWPRALVECRRLVAAEDDFDEAVARLDVLAAAAPRTTGVHS